MQRLLKTNDVAQILGVRRNALYSYIAIGKLKAHKLGGNGRHTKRHWRIKQKDLDAFIGS